MPRSAARAMLRMPVPPLAGQGASAWPAFQAGLNAGPASPTYASSLGGSDSPFECDFVRFETPIRCLSLAPAVCPTGEVETPKQASLDRRLCRSTPLDAKQPRYAVGVADCAQQMRSVSGNANLCESACICGKRSPLSLAQAISCSSDCTSSRCRRDMGRCGLARGWSGSVHPVSVPPAGSAIGRRPHRQRACSV